MFFEAYENVCEGDVGSTTRALPVGETTAASRSASVDVDAVAIVSSTIGLSKAPDAVLCVAVPCHICLCYSVIKSSHLVSGTNFADWLLTNYMRLSFEF